MCQCQEQYFPTKRMKGGLGTTTAQSAVSIGGSTATLIATLAGGPIAGAVTGGVTMLAGAITSLFQPDYSKIDASNIANQTGQLMQENLNGWTSLSPNQKIPAVQEFFEQNYITLWNSLVSGCSNPALGMAGENCISERSPTGKYPYASYYLNPIQNDPNIVDQTGNVSFTDPLTGINITIPYSPVTSVVSLASSVSNSLSQATGLNISDMDLFVLGGALLVLALI